MGLIHTFILPSLLTEGKHPPFSMFARRLMHYFFNSFVLDDPSDKDHLPVLHTMEGARDLLSLFVIVMFLNVLDERTYELAPTTIYQPLDVLEKCQVLYDLNSIPVIERHHLSYTRGLALDLVHWFFEHYSISSCDSDADEIDGYRDILVPFLVHTGRHIIRYKRTAVKCGYFGPSDQDQIQLQVRSVLLYCREILEEYMKQNSEEKDAGYDSDRSGSVDDPSHMYDLKFDIGKYTISEREGPRGRGNQINNHLIAGRTLADQHFFNGLSLKFNLENQHKQHLKLFFFFFLH
jgi:hypothetical protein